MVLTPSGLPLGSPPKAKTGPRRQPALRRVTPPDSSCTTLELPALPATATLPPAFVAAACTWCRRAFLPARAPARAALGSPSRTPFF